MHYIKRNRDRRKQNRIEPRRRGGRMTFISLAATAAFIAAAKAANPGADLRPVIMLFAGVALACVMMSAISARRGKDD